jgi:lysophospholipase L1-like esterase
MCPVPIRLLPTLSAFSLAACSTVSDPPAAPVSGPAKVINAGVSGNTSGQLLARLDRDVLSRNPDVVVVMVGTNDRLNSHSFTEPEIYGSNVDALVVRILANRARVVLVTPPTCVGRFLLTRHDPKHFVRQSPSERMEEVRRILVGIARKRGVGLVDFHRYLTGNKLGDERATSLLRNPANSDAKDGVHLTPEGSRRLAELVATELKRMGLNRGTIVCLGDSITLGSPAASYPAFLGEILSR